MEIIEIVTPVAVLIGVGIAIPLLIQFVHSVSRNMAHGDVNLTEEMSKTSKQV